MIALLIEDMIIATLADIIVAANVSWMQHT